YKVLLPFVGQRNILAKLDFECQPVFYGHAGGKRQIVFINILRFVPETQQVFLVPVDGNRSRRCYLEGFSGIRPESSNAERIFTGMCVQGVPTIVVSTCMLRRCNDPAGG